MPFGSENTPHYSGVAVLWLVLAVFSLVVLALGFAGKLRKDRELAQTIGIQTDARLLQAKKWEDDCRTKGGEPVATSPRLCLPKGAVLGIEGE